MVARDHFCSAGHEVSAKIERVEDLMGDKGYLSDLNLKRPLPMGVRGYACTRSA
jgi:hypothetical protein